MVSFVWKHRKDDHDETTMKFALCLAWFLELFLPFYSCWSLIFYYPLPLMELYQTIVMIIAAMCLIWQDSVWEHHNPWSVFGTESIDELRIDSDYLNIDNLRTLFDDWSKIAQAVTKVFLILFLFLALGRLVLICTRK